MSSIGETNPMTPKESVDLYDLAVGLRAAVLYSLGQSLAAYFPPSEEPPPELRALLDRVDADRP
jgi:hypothetical protein